MHSNKFVFDDPNKIKRWLKQISSMIQQKIILTVKGTYFKIVI